MPNSAFVEQLKIWKACEFDIFYEDRKEKLAYVQFKTRVAEARKACYPLRNRKGPFLLKPKRFSRTIVRFCRILVDPTRSGSGPQIIIWGAC